MLMLRILLFKNTKRIITKMFAVKIPNITAPYNPNKISPSKNNVNLIREFNNEIGIKYLILLLTRSKLKKKGVKILNAIEITISFNSRV